MGQVRTRLQGVERLMDILNSGIAERLAVLHTNAESMARQLLGRGEIESGCTSLRSM